MYIYIYAFPVSCGYVGMSFEDRMHPQSIPQAIKTAPKASVRTILAARERAKQQRLKDISGGKNMYPGDLWW